MLTSQLFYKQYGIRKISQLLNPKVFILRELPRDSMYHYIDDNTGKDVDLNATFLSQYDRKVYLDIVEELNDPMGKPIRKPGTGIRMAKDFFIANRNYKLSEHPYTKVNNPLILVAANYKYLNEFYRYVDTPFSSYYKWFNVHKTLWSYVNATASVSDRQHFIPLFVPKLLPSLDILKIYKDKNVPAMLGIFTDSSMLAILDIWRWLVEESELSSMDVLEDSNLHKVNLVISNSDDKAVLLNLGYLRSWVKEHDTLTDSKSKVKTANLTVGKFFLKLLMLLQTHVEEIDDEVLQQEITDSAKTDSSSDIDDTSLQLEEDVDKDIDMLNVVVRNAFQQKGISINEDGDVKTSTVTVKDLDLKATLVNTTPDKTLTELVVSKAKEGSIPANTVKLYLKDIKKYGESLDPYTGKPIKDSLVFSKEELVLDVEDTKIVASSLVKDKSMLQSSLLSFDKKYVTEVLNKDIIRVISDIQNAGIVIKKHTIENSDTKLGSYDVHTLSIKPIDGAASTIKFKLPKVNEHGTMVINGKEAVMRKQRVDNPIRKIKPNIVALTSYYGKVFVSRSTKKADDFIEWVVKNIRVLGMDSDSTISKVSPSNSYDNSFKAPYVYNGLSAHYNGFKVGEITLVFKHSERFKITDKDTIAKLEKDRRVVGHDDSGGILLIDYDDVFYMYKDDTEVKIGDIFTLLSLPIQKAPMGITEIRIFRKYIPLGIAMGYYFGFKGLLKLFNVKYTTTDKLRYRPTVNEYVIRFKDVTYIFNRGDKEAALILAGFNKFKKLLLDFTIGEMENKDTYFNLLASLRLGPIYIRELTLLKDMFIDSITLSILEEMKEATTFTGLLLSANVLLLDYNFPDSQDLFHMRIRGYERIGGMIYSQMIQSIRSFRNRNIAGRSKVDVGHYDIWNKIVKDNSVKLVEQTNPIQNLKEIEVLTYVGAGGRSTDTLNRASRAFHVSDLGVVSESTVDSSSVGVNAYLTANPKLMSLRGTIAKSDTLDNSNLYSTSMLLSPSAIHDDSKRVNFISIQNTHTIGTEAYRQPYLRTGYEYVIGKRTSEQFSYSARMDGVVTSIDDNGMIVTYKDSTVKGIELGSIYGAAEGTYYPHTIQANVTINQKFKKGQVLAYNTGFFEQDILDPNEIIFKTGLPVKTALYESNQTFEDSSAVSNRTRSSFKTTVSKVKTIVVEFDQNVHDLVSVGNLIKPRDTLMIIEDAISGNIGNLSNTTIQSLKSLSSQTPKSKYNGKVGKVDIFYNGDKDAMSDTLRKIADKYDRKISSKAKSVGSTIKTNEVNGDLNVSGKPLPKNHMAIYIYIDIVQDMGVGDKAIFGNQLKSVIGEVINYDMTTESGDTIDAVFGYRSIAARIVNSPIIMGTTITLLKVIANKAVGIYKNGK